jgi:hypothetical protein
MQGTVCLTLLGRMRLYKQVYMMCCLQASASVCKCMLMCSRAVMGEEVQMHGVCVCTWAVVVQLSRTGKITTSWKELQLAQYCDFVGRSELWDCKPLTYVFERAYTKPQCPLPIH